MRHDDRTPTGDVRQYDLTRRIYRALVMHYVEGLKQAEIARLTGQSIATVSRLIKQGHDLGMVEITVRAPFQPSLELERRLARAAGLMEALVVPNLSANDEVALASVGEAAAGLLLSRLKDGDTICISGGKGVSALVAGLNPARRYDVSVVPATGLVEGPLYTDVNYVAAQMAEKLGGRAHRIHAPMFADTVDQRAMLIDMRSTRDILDRARHADIAVVGVGSVTPAGSSYYDLHPELADDRTEIERSGAEAELLAHLLDGAGRVCRYQMNDRLVAVTPEELSRVPFSMGVAVGPAKIGPIRAVLRGRHLKGLVTDETTADAVLPGLEVEAPAARS
ncbi:sugar-binding transcriptional regulator [Tistrella mobilis]